MRVQQSAALAEPSLFAICRFLFLRRNFMNLGKSLFKSALLFFLILNSGYAAYRNDFQGIDLREGKSKSIKIDSKKYTILYFLSSSCPCSQAHFTHLNQLQQKYPQFSFIGFHSHKAIPKEKAMDYFSQFEINFPILLDKSLKFANQFSALKTPHIFVVDKRGEIIYQGAATNSRNPEKADKFYLQEVLGDLAQDLKPRYTNKKSIGCYIQR